LKIVLSERRVPSPPKSLCSQELAAETLHDDASGLQDIGPVTDVQGFEDTLFHQQHSDTLAGDALHSAENFGDQLWRQAHGGLVEQEQIRPGHEQTGKELLLVLDPKHETERWEPLSDFNPKLNGKHRSDPRPTRSRLTSDILRHLVSEAAKSPLTGQVGPQKIKGEKYRRDSRFLTVKERAQMHGLSVRAQNRLDRVARVRPDLLQQIVKGELSIDAGYQICTNSKSSFRALKQLRYNWQRATEAERQTFCAEIAAAANGSSRPASSTNNRVLGS
jgi:hypothetical protein